MTLPRWWPGRLSFVILISFIAVTPILAQAYVDPPEFESVSINPTNGQVTIKWNPSTNTNIAGYIIQEEKVAGQNFPIDTIFQPIAAYAFTFSYPKVLSGPVSFNIAAMDSSNNLSARTVPSHITMFTSLVYDSCSAAIRVNWTPYVGWGNNLKGYQVFRIQNNSQIDKVDDVGPTQTSSLIPNILENSTYSFYVTAERNDGITVTSTMVTRNTNLPAPPAYIYGDNAVVKGTKLVDLHFSIDPSALNDAYRLYRGLASSGTSVPIRDFTGNIGNTINYTDTLPSNAVYNYRLVYMNSCNKEGISSNPINNILLQGSSNNLVNSLNWNNFADWANGVNGYEIFRSESNGAFQSIGTVAGNETNFQDRMSSQGNLASDLCYQVKATSNPDPLGRVQVSESNTFCINLLGGVFVPNAFTPNSDGKNDIFKPSFSVLPSKYLFIIYNRYGFKVFETTNVSEGWDGILPGGKKAQEDAFIYYLRIENSLGETVEKRGNFSVIYP